MPIVYKLTCETTGQIYFGWTVYTLAQRFSKHCRSHRSHYISRCIQKYGKENFIAEHLFEFDCGEDAAKKEIELIALHKTNICRYPDSNGMNMTDGGEWGTEGYKHDDITKQKIRETSKGRRHSKKTLKLISRNSKAIIRKPWTEDRKKRMSEIFKKKWAEGSYVGMTGKKASEKTRKKMSKARLGIKLTKETKEKLSKAHKGKAKSSETRKKISEALKGNQNRRTDFINKVRIII